MSDFYFEPVALILQQAQFGLGVDFVDALGGKARLLAQRYGSGSFNPGKSLRRAGLNFRLRDGVLGNPWQANDHRSCFNLTCLGARRHSRCNAGNLSRRKGFLFSVHSSCAPLLLHHCARVHAFGNEE